MTGRGSLSTVPSDACFCMEPTGPFTELERGGTGGGSCIVWSVSESYPGPLFQEGCDL